MSLKPLCACMDRATTTWRGHPICNECLTQAQDNESARYDVGILYVQSTELGSEVIREWADEATEHLRADQTR